MSRCTVQYVRITSPGNRSEAQIGLRHLPRLSLRIMKVLCDHRPLHLFTFECGWVSLLVAGFQTLGLLRSIRHVILQFIMREKEPTLRSTIKCFFLRWILSSVDTVVCSSKQEAEYYKEMFGWEDKQVAVVLFHSDPQYLQSPSTFDDGYILSAGRTFRDYETFLEAVRGINYRVILVTSPRNVVRLQVPANVTLRFDLPLSELTSLIQRCALVVVPLQNRRISTGQSVILHAMAMGKPVVVTRTAGTEDYVDHFENGLLVPPGDSARMREAIEYLMLNESERIRIGNNARARVASRHLPEHYAAQIRDLVCPPGASETARLRHRATPSI